jgi:hypothetical protein
MALKGARADGIIANPEWLFYGAILGGSAGCLLFLLDGQKADKTIRKPSTLIGRFFAILSVPTFFLPYVGLTIGGISLFMNRRVTGWPIVVTWIGLVLSGIISGLVTLALLFIPHSN